MGGVQKVKDNGKEFEIHKNAKDRQQYVRGECQEMKKFIWKYIFFKKP